MMIQLLQVWELLAITHEKFNLKGKLYSWRKINWKLKGGPEKEMKGEGGEEKEEDGTGGGM